MVSYWYLLLQGFSYTTEYMEMKDNIGAGNMMPHETGRYIYNIFDFKFGQGFVNELIKGSVHFLVMWQLAKRDYEIFNDILISQ